MHKGTSSKIRVGTNHSLVAQTGWVIRSDFYREKVSREETIPKAPNQCWTTRGHFPPPKGRNHSLRIGKVSSVRTACTQQTWWPSSVPVWGKLRQMWAHSLKF